MGCGASVHAQGPAKDAFKEATKDTVAVPLAEDKQVPQEPGFLDVEQSGTSQGSPTAAGAPAPASVPTPGASPDSDDAQPLEPIQSVDSAPPSSWADELSPCSPAPAAPGAPSWSDDPTPPAAQLPAARPPQSFQPSQGSQLQPSASGGFALDSTRLVLGASLSSSCCSVADGADRSSASRSSAVLDPAVTPSSETATVTLLSSESQGGFPARASARYMDDADLTISGRTFEMYIYGDGDSDDDDEVAALFTLQAWKRFYNYNKKKPQDLMVYFWRRYPPEEFSCFCVSFRNQALLSIPFMAENCMHGYCARLEDLGLAQEVFLRMYALHDPELDQFLIVGLLLVAGSALPPALASLSAFDGFVYRRADTSRLVVKQFVSSLLVGSSPLYSLKLISSREVL